MLSASLSTRWAGMRGVVSLLVAAAAWGCGGSTEPKKDVIPATITASTTDTLRAAAGTTINTLLTVTVKNAAGQPIENTPVTFAVATGGGTLSGTAVQTDTAGNASTTWTLGRTAGVQTITATSGAAPGVTFVAVAGAGNASTLTKVDGADNQTATAGGTVPVNPSVKVADQFGNAVAGVLVTFIAGNGGVVTGGAVNTDANGTATVGSWKLGPSAGANTLTVTAAGVTSPVTFTATSTVGAVTRVTITSAAIPTLAIGQTATVTAAAFDANNNRVTGATIAFTSDNSAVATVNGTTGVVTAVGGGTANIIATSNGIAAGTPVTVIGHPTPTVAATIPAGGRVRSLAVAGNQVYAAASTSVVNVDLSSASLGWTLGFAGTVVGVGANAANTVVTAAVNNNELYIINPATHTVTDSVALAAVPVNMVMTAAGARAFVDEGNFQMEIIDVAARTVVATAPLPGTVTAMKMGPGDTVLYAGTIFGNVLEINALTGAVKRTFQPGTRVSDLTVSRDGKTLVVSDGTPTVTLIPLATGGLTGALDYGNNVFGMALTPDASELWVAQGTSIYASPSDGSGGFQTELAVGRLTVSSANFTRIVFSATGAAALAYDDGGLNLVVLK